MVVGSKNDPARSTMPWFLYGSGYHFEPLYPDSWTSRETERERERERERETCLKVDIKTPKKYPTFKSTTRLHAIGKSEASAMSEASAHVEGDETNHKPVCTGRKVSREYDITAGPSRRPKTPPPKPPPAGCWTPPPPPPKRFDGVLSKTREPPMVAAPAAPGAAVRAAAAASATTGSATGSATADAANEAAAAAAAAAAATALRRGSTPVPTSQAAAWPQRLSQ